MPTPKEVAAEPVALVRAEEEPVPAGAEPVALAEGGPVAAVRVLVEAVQEVPLVAERGPVVVRVAPVQDRAAAEAVPEQAQVPEQEQEARALVAAGTPTRSIPR